MAKISVENVASAARKVRAMSCSEQLALTDEIFQQQPNLLASCLVQKGLRVVNGGLEYAVSMLLICYQSMKESGFEWPVIPEDEQAWQLMRMTAAAQLSSNLADRDLSYGATRQYLMNHPEQPLLAYVLAESNCWLQQIAARRTETESDKYALMASINLVNCIAYTEAKAKPV